MSPSMNSPSWLRVVRRRLATHWARPQALFLNASGVQAANGPPQAFADWCRQHGGGAVLLFPDQVKRHLPHEWPFLISKNLQMLSILPYHHNKPGLHL